MDKIETLGQYLCQERKRQDISLDQIAYSTRISLKLLRALEEDNHAILPPEPFVRGYLQAYAKYLKIDSKDILLRYQQYIACNPNIYIKGPQSAGVYSDTQQVQEKKIFLYAIISLLVVLCASGVYFFNQSDTKKSIKEVKKILAIAKAPVPSAKKTEPAPKKEIKKEMEKEDQVEIKEEVTEEVTAEEEELEYNLTLTAKEDVWIRFQTDEKEIKDIILRKDRRITLRADEVIKLFSGNLAGLEATFNGETLPTLAYKDRKRSVVLPISEIPNVPLPLFPKPKEEEEP